MNAKSIFLLVSLAICVAAIVLVIIKGPTADKVNLDAISEVGESVLHHIDKTGRILTAISDEEEMEIGDTIHEKTRSKRLIKHIENSPLDRYITAVGLKVAENVKRKNIRYKFHIVDSDWPNASAGPGGHVYITMGLLQELESEAELAAIIGHEITHTDAKHAIGAIQYKIKRDSVTGDNMNTIADAGYRILFRPGYSEVQETEADLGGVYLAYQAGYHPLAVINAFKNIRDYAPARSGKRGSITPIGDTLSAVGNMIGRYFMTHPMTPERIAKIQHYVHGEGMLEGGRKFYIGQKNYIEKIPYSQKAYKEELNSEYTISEMTIREDQVSEASEQDETFTEVYTVYGRLYAGMDLSKVEELLPEGSRKFKREDRIGYKSIKVYRFDTQELEDTVGLWIEIEERKVTGIRLIK